MDQKEGSDDHLIRIHLKALLLHLAARSSQPSVELQNILREVIDELHEEVSLALKRRAQLRLVDSQEITSATT